MIFNVNGRDAVESVLNIISERVIYNGLYVCVCMIGPPDVTSVTPANAGDVVTVGQVLAVAAGSSFCLVCMADLGLPEASERQWLRNNDGVDPTDICIDFRANGSMLCFTQITTAYSDTYNCTVSNSAGSDSAIATVRVAGTHYELFPMIYIYTHSYSPSKD